MSGTEEKLAALNVGSEAPVAPEAAAPVAAPSEEKRGKRESKPKKEKEAVDAVASSSGADEKVTFNADKDTDFNSWYEQILICADVLDKRYPVKGMPVFKGYGFYMHNAIMGIIEQEWEKQEIEKAQFPLVIPETFLEKEKDHVKGFESECFWVTKGGLNDLEVRLALRPTSETAMYYMFNLWVRSFRDLPLKIHQTCNVFRYETKDTTPLIRVREIFWNEAHTCHETPEQALDNLEQAWSSYMYLIRDCLGVFGLRLRRPIWDKFAGAEHTDVMDSCMPSGKVLQIVGAHYLGQKFAKVFDIKFLNRTNKFEHAYMTCYGISTRILASVLSQHGDNKGLILPPAIARYQVVIVPIVMKKTDTAVVEKAKEIAKTLQDAGLRVHVDDRAVKPGEKFYYWEMKGVPIRIEVGPRDIAANQACVIRRDNSEKANVPLDELIPAVRERMDAMLSTLKEKSKSFFESRITTCSSLAEAAEVVKGKGGFARIPFFSMDSDAKEADREVHAATGGEVRGWVPGEAPPAEGTLCIVTGKPAKYWGYVAKSY